MCVPGAFCFKHGFSVCVCSRHAFLKKREKTNEHCCFSHTHTHVHLSIQGVVAMCISSKISSFFSMKFLFLSSKISQKSCHSKLFVKWYGESMVHYITCEIQCKSMVLVLTDSYLLHFIDIQQQPICQDQSKLTSKMPKDYERMQSVCPRGGFTKPSQQYM